MKIFLAIIAITTLYSAALAQESKTLALKAGAKAKTEQNDSTSSVKAVEMTKTILFFINPNGRPCQMQDKIIQDMKPTLIGLASVVYVKTTNPDDRDKFSKYGIRGLPSLILLDKDGTVSHRFTPGIQNAETILAILEKQVD